MMSPPEGRRDGHPGSWSTLVATLLRILMLTSLSLTGSALRLCAHPCCTQCCVRRGDSLAIRNHGRQEDRDSHRAAGPLARGCLVRVLAVSGLEGLVHLHGRAGATYASGQAHARAVQGWRQLPPNCFATGEIRHACRISYACPCCYSLYSSS